MSEFLSYSQIVSVESNDVLVILDANDDTMSPQGTTKWIELSQLSSLFLANTGGTLTGTVTIETAYPFITLENTSTAQYSGAGFALINTASTMGNQGGVSVNAGINNSGATEGYVTLTQINYQGGSVANLLTIDLNAQTFTIDLPVIAPDVTISESASAGGVLTVTNTHSAPSSPSSQFISAASGDSVLGLQVSGDTNWRYIVGSGGTMSWGSGSAGADTTLARGGTGILSLSGALQLSTYQNGGVLKVTNNQGTPTDPSIWAIAHAAGDNTFGIQVSGDTNYRFFIDSNGKMNWGSGTAAVDTDLYRSAANTLHIDNNLIVNGVITAFSSVAAQASKAGGGLLQVQNSTSSPTSPNAWIQNAAGGDTAFGIDVASDADYRFLIDSNGRMYWGTGSAATDTSLYRSATNTLNATGAIVAGGYMKAASLQASEGSSSGGVLQVTNTTSSPTSATMQAFAAAGGDSTFSIAVSGDTYNRLLIDSNGKMNWGSGSAATDLNFSRASAATAQINGALKVTRNGSAGALLVVANTGSAPTGPNVQVISESAGDSALGLDVTGDADFRFTVDSNGKMNWGSGSAVGDTDLYRGGANLLQTDDTFNAVSGLQVNGTSLPSLQATTGTAGYTLINGTGNIISWTAPNDGNLHRVVIYATLNVTSAETGGGISYGYTSPSGTVHSPSLFASGLGTGDSVFAGNVVLVEPGITFTISQSAALTVGAAKLFVELWAS